MLHILHGTWLTQEGAFLLWGEAIRREVTLGPGRRPTVSPHPYLTDIGTLIEVLDAHAPHTEPYAISPPVMWLPGKGKRPSWSPEARRHGAPPHHKEEELLAWRIESSITLGASHAHDLLLRLPDETPRFTLGRDLRYWQQVAFATLHALIEQQYMPVVDDQHVSGHTWQPLLPELPALADRMPTICRAVTEGRTQAQPALDIVRDYMRSVIERFITQLDFAAKTDDIAAFAHRKRSLNADTVALWRTWQEIPTAGLADDFRVCFRLEEPQGDDDDWYLRYMLQAANDPAILLEADQVWQASGRTLVALERRFNDPHETLLRALGQAAESFSPLERSLRQAAPVGVPLSEQDAYRFLTEALPKLEAQGFAVLVPNWWKRAARLKARLTLDSGTSPGLLAQDKLFDYKWEVAVGENALSRDEFEELVALKQPLVRFKGEWVALDTAQINAALRFFEQQPEEGSGLLDALHAAAGDIGTPDGIEVEQVRVEGWLDDLLQRLKQPDATPPPAQPQGLEADLRPYQQRGFGWLVQMRELGLGACLADDMGLGKTIQAIALLQYQREQQPDGVKPALVVCPTSVIGNWRHEIRRFAPALRVMRHHGPDRYKEEDFAEAVTDVDIVITSYALLSRDRPTLTGVAWGDVILDEAQNIKNPSTKKAQTARALQADFRLALTGTPVENRLRELWSILQFLNPGYLGSQRTFSERFATPIERYNDDQAAATLRQLTAPFILRRVKTDKTIISDLPDKFENKVYCSLSTEQATLYEAVVREEMALLEQAADNMQRRGSVLRMLTRLKQVCNHPAHFLKEDDPSMIGRSGKLDRLIDMVDEVLDNDQKALIFTQYAQMGNLLAPFLADHTRREVLYLHGGTPSTKREDMIATFQSAEGPPVFILSLRAGGTGLTLTQANNVFHYDRWYNPAVEDQATDRAYRIGQHRDVQVHKMITLGTLEERIDDLIEHKKALADSIIGEGETFISEMSNDEILELVSLRED